MNIIDIKRRLYELCRQYLEQRIATVNSAIQAAQHAANDETKSSSGDKYETGRAMMQLEIEQNAAQLGEALKIKRVLDTTALDGPAEIVRSGSLVITDSEKFFIAISLGKVTVDDTEYMVISPSSPMGQALLGLKTGDTFTFRGRSYAINQII